MTTHKLFFHNPGEIDIRAVTTMGVNVKLGDSPIGHFGTGVKYAIAGVLRLGGSISIWSGQQRFDFFALAENIRGQQFQIIHMANMEDDKAVSLGFTTDLGKDWEPWMLYRELRSNALDEGGDASPLDLEPAAGQTLIEVSCEEIWQAHAHKSQFWLEGEPLWAGYGVEVHPWTTENLYYHGIRATASESSKTAKWAYHYSITSQMRLTEDRTFASFYDARTMIAKAIARCTELEIIETVLGSDAEADGFDFDHWDVAASPEFVQAVLARIEKHEKVPASARALVARHHEEELEEAELEIASTFEEMERRAPEDAPEIRSSKYDWQSETEARIEGLEKELKYWKACARKLAKVAA